MLSGCRRPQPRALGPAVWASPGLPIPAHCAVPSTHHVCQMSFSKAVHAGAPPRSAKSQYPCTTFLVTPGASAVPAALSLPSNHSEPSLVLLQLCSSPRAFAPAFPSAGRLPTRLPLSPSGLCLVSFRQKPRGAWRQGGAQSTDTRSTDSPCRSPEPHLVLSPRVSRSLPVSLIPSHFSSLFSSVSEMYGLLVLCPLPSCQLSEHRDLPCGFPAGLLGLRTVPGMLQVVRGHWE